MKAEQFTDVVTYHGEGPIWDSVAGVLRWVDMLNGDILTMAPGGAIERQHVGTIAAAMRPRADGGLVIAVEHGFVLMEPDGQLGSEQTAFTDPGIRLNEGGVDRQGRFFCGSMPYDQGGPRGAFYRFDPSGPGAPIAEMFGEVTISNGVAWNAAGDTMFYIDTPTHRVDVFDFDTAAGVPSGRRPLVHIDPAHGSPDGMALDAEGGLWVAIHRGHAVHRYLPDGTLDTIVEVPPAQVTACAFGGPGLDELYITTSRENLPDGADPLAGALFHTKPGVRGLPLGTFAA
ncbi:MAG TPA: SMP-30/gluconolactonase/LRE family protein [Streptosporangiaceae bacterium]|nr:SMP-30/gluconolactonase/LRE family protein [Streptosporangiaceae bacterium]